jgi:hypothetical protein
MDKHCDNILDLIEKNIFLPSGHLDGNKFAATDSKELFERNLKKQALDWRYRTKDITYTLNSNGYRTDEFDSIDWAEAVVIFGCSIVFGVGITDDETISATLSKILDRPVINMGVCASSVTFATHNALILNRGYPTPKAVVNIWSSIDRSVFYSKDYVRHAVFEPNEDSFFAQWNKNDCNPQVNALFSQMTNRNLWKDIPYYEASFFEHTANCLDCEYIHSVDGGRDLQHPGHITANIVAQKIAYKLKL